MQANKPEIATIATRPQGSAPHDGVDGDRRHVVSGPEEVRVGLERGDGRSVAQSLRDRHHVEAGGDQGGPVRVAQPMEAWKLTSGRSRAFTVRAQFRGRSLGGAGWNVSPSMRLNTRVSSPSLPRPNGIRNSSCFTALNGGVGLLPCRGSSGFCVGATLLRLPEMHQYLACIIRLVARCTNSSASFATAASSAWSDMARKGRRDLDPVA